MSTSTCTYCVSTQELKRVKQRVKCQACSRVVQECSTEVQELFIESTHDVPFCIVTPDFAENEQYKTAPMDDDPFENIGFITTFTTSTCSIAPTFTASSRLLPGMLAELERVMGETLQDGVSPNAVVATDTVRAYLHIVDTCSILGVKKETSDQAFQLFRECSSSSLARNRSVEGLATAAIVHAAREAQEPRTLQEVSQAANLPQKELGRHLKILADVLKLTSPANSNSITTHMPRFCGILGLNKATQDLATHIGEVVITKSFCIRRNPISISAAAIYLSCQLEDKRKTQTEICKATGLTEVTLRKVYKELLENLDALLPADYIPAVPMERAFPMTAAALGRVSSLRMERGSKDSSDMGSLSRQSSLSSLDFLARTDSLLSRQGSLDASTSGAGFGSYLANPHLAGSLGLSPKNSPSRPQTSPVKSPANAAMPPPVMLPAAGRLAEAAKPFHFLERTSSTGGQGEERPTAGASHPPRTLAFPSSTVTPLSQPMTFHKNGLPDMDPRTFFAHYCNLDSPGSVPPLSSPLGGSSAPLAQGVWPPQPAPHTLQQHANPASFPPPSWRVPSPEEGRSGRAAAENGKRKSSASRAEQEAARPRELLSRLKRSSSDPPATLARLHQDLNGEPPAGGVEVPAQASSSMQSLADLSKVAAAAAATVGSFGSLPPQLWPFMPGTAHGAHFSAVPSALHSGPPAQSSKQDVNFIQYGAPSLTLASGRQSSHPEGASVVSTATATPGQQAPGLLGWPPVATSFGASDISWLGLATPRCDNGSSAAVSKEASTFGSDRDWLTDKLRSPEGRLGSLSQASGRTLLDETGRQGARGLGFDFLDLGTKSEIRTPQVPAALVAGAPDDSSSTPRTNCFGL